MKVAVIGMGGVGAAAAWHLARSGHQVECVERFELDHDLGGSYGGSRIYRHVYPDGLYTRLMDAAWPLWLELEKASGRELMLRCGGIFFGPEGHPDMGTAEAALRESRIPFEILGIEEAARRHPALRLMPGEVAIHQRDAGLLRASACVRAMARLARAAGARLREHTEVLNLESRPAGLRIHLEPAGSLDVDAAVLAPGPWARRFLPPDSADAIQVTRQRYHHFRPDPGCEARFAPDRLPIWIDMNSWFYGFPSHDEIPGPKVAEHLGGKPVDPDRVDRGPDPEFLERARRYVAERLPGLSPEVIYEKTCLYEKTPDEDFILDRLPGLAGVSIVAGTSGHGFKFLPLLGELAARLALGENPGIDLARFRVTRFQGNS